MSLVVVKPQSKMDEVNVNNAKMRPNIRIEIQNNLLEAMEVDDNPHVSDNNEEEGEIVDQIEEEDVAMHITSNTNNTSATRRAKPPLNSQPAFETGINIFDKIEQEKRTARAKRFELDPKDIKNFTDDDLKMLHDSLGVTEGSTQVRFEALHMRGTEDMSSEDILNYFKKFAPHTIEWISDESCNVVWTESISSARALFYLSKPISGMPVEGACDPFIDRNRSVLLREVKSNGEIHVSDINAPIPPGYWRLGDVHPRAKYILLRFALMSDKKPFKAERFSEYYKKHGNPNYGGLRGIITESKKQQFKGIFDRHTDSKNPWGSLAKNWDGDDAEPVVSPVSAVAITAAVDASKSSLKHRLGMKRVAKQPDEVVDSEKKFKMPRMRMYADDEEEKVRRKKQLSALKLQKKPQDLRAQLSSQNHKSTDSEVKNIDLGTKLRNRKLKEILLNEAKELKAADIVVENAENELFEEEEEDDDDCKTGSKVTVVIKRSKQPAVASTVWSRVERKASPKERKRASSSSSSTSSDSDSSSSDASSSSASSSGSSGNTRKKQTDKERPGFSAKHASNKNHKSPLRIEINNDLYQK